MIEANVSYAIQLLPKQSKEKFIDEDEQFVDCSLYNEEIPVSSFEEFLKYIKDNKIEWNKSIHSNFTSLITYDYDGLHLYEVVSYTDKGIMTEPMKKLINVWKDTESRFGDYTLSQIGAYQTKSYSKIFKIPKHCIIKVENIDCIESARQLSTLGKTCILNMASYKRPGGGVLRGAMAQEEELARRSNLTQGLSAFEYPLEMDAVLYNTNVTFFKDKYYNVVDPFKCDVITIAAVNLNGLERPSNYLEITKAKIQSMFHEAINNGCNNIVLSAFGCGVFKNDPNLVATLFKGMIELTGAKEHFDNIVFAILNDNNSVGNNFSIFKEVIEC